MSIFIVIIPLYFYSIWALSCDNGNVKLRWRSRKVWIGKYFYLLFANFDWWIGIFWDAAGRRLYIFPIPCYGFVICLWSRKYKEIRETNERIARHY